MLVIHSSRGRESNHTTPKSTVESSNTQIKQDDISYLYPQENNKLTTWIVSELLGILGSSDDGHLVTAVTY